MSQDTTEMKIRHKYCNKKHYGFAKHILESFSQFTCQLSEWYALISKASLKQLIN